MSGPRGAGRVGVAITRPSNGRIESTNNLPQDLRRKAHGFTNHANFEARGILAT